MKFEIARVKIEKGANRMAIARAFAETPCFHMYRLGEVVSTMRSYERNGLLTITDNEAILYHTHEPPQPRATGARKECMK